MFGGTESRIDSASTNMMNSKPTVHPPFGLDCDIVHREIHPKTFKEFKADEAKIKVNLIPPRLPLETNIKLSYASTMAMDYVRSPVKVKQSREQLLNKQHQSTKRLAAPIPKERILQEDGKVKRVETKIELYSAEEAQRDQERRQQQINNYEEFIREKTKTTLKPKDTSSWY